MEYSVTVVIATRNRHQCLVNVLPTYARQQYVTEIIVVDDGSTPPIAKIDLDRLAPNVRLIRHESCAGLPHCRNVGAQHARSDWILYSDDDVFLDLGYVAELLASHERTGASVLAGRIIYLQNGESAEQGVARWAHVPSIPSVQVDFDTDREAPAPDDVVALHLQSTTLVKRSVVLNVGWDARVFRFPSFFREETDFFLRAHSAGHLLVHCGKALSFHLSPDESRSGGCRDVSRFLYELGVARNNHAFLNRHYAYLKRCKALAQPRWVVEANFLKRRWLSPSLGAAYGWYYRSALRHMVRWVKRRLGLLPS